MIYKYNKIIILFLLVFIIFSNFTSTVLSKDEIKKTDIEKYSFTQELSIPIDTSLEVAKYQPIDIRVDFKNSCYAEDEKNNSVRVGMDIDDSITELESQIYDLEFSDNNQISSCSLVFLIPEEANGEEEYFVFYDSTKKDTADYPDHIQIEDTHYFYEPISGQKIDFDYYKVVEEGYVNYAVIQTGELLGNPIAQNVIKFKLNSKEVETYNIDQLATFDLRYGIFETPDYYGTSWATEVEKTILIEGNLMARMRLSCYSPDNKAYTDNIYTYYYSPIDVKRIYVNQHHEVLETINIEKPVLNDGTYCGIVSIKSKSATIEKMNVGEILPQMNVYSDTDTIEEYSIPSNPDSEEEEAVLSTEADIDLGTKAWISLNDPQTEKAHGMILESNTGINEEQDGVQVKAWVKQNIKLPGLEADTGSCYLMRNAYEKESGHNTVLNKGFEIYLNIDFVTFEKGGYEKVDEEADFFQEMIKNVPIKREDVVEEPEEEIEKYNLQVFVHFARSFPLGSLLSAALGRNIPYISAELYLEDNFKSSGSVGRLPIGAIELDFEGKNLFQIISTIIGIFDWRNLTFFKSIIFPDLEPGKYLIKIYRENTWLKKAREYIGFSIIDVSENLTNHIYCRSQSKIENSIIDQDGKGVKNTRFILKNEEVIISDGLSNENGSCILYAPCYANKPYILEVVYDGFLISEKQIKLRILNKYITVRESFEIEYFDFEIEVRDNWNFPISIEVNPVLTSDEMKYEEVINPEKKERGKYIFKRLYPSKYVLKLGYKSFDYEQNINIDNFKTLDIVFSAEYNIDFDLMNSYGNMLESGSIKILRENQFENFEIMDGESSINVPPGEYEIIIFDGEDETIAQLKLDIKGDKNLDLVTAEDSMMHQILSYLGLILAVISIFYILWKRNCKLGLKFLIISILIISISTPWWILNGDDGLSSTETKALLTPPKIVTLSQTSEVVGGEISQVPEEVTLVLNVILYMLIVSIVLIVLSLVAMKKLRKISIGLQVFSVIIMILTVGIFFYAMSQLTEVGVGSFIGKGDIDVSLPGVSENLIINCSWGPGVGFYIPIIVVILLISQVVAIRFISKKKK